LHETVKLENQRFSNKQKLNSSLFNTPQIRSFVNTLTVDGKSAIELESTVITGEDVAMVKVIISHSTADKESFKE